jgi:hypothetical protein
MLGAGIIAEQALPLVEGVVGELSIIAAREDVASRAG